jgi:hypothetical protein
MYYYHQQQALYLSIVLETSVVIEIFKNAHVIIINKMSMMTSNMLSVVEQQLKQSMHLENISPFETKLVLIVGNLAQLPPIYKHTIRNNDILCKSCQNNKITFLIHFHESCYKS